MPPKRKSTSWRIGYWPVAIVLALGGIVLIFQWSRLVAFRLAGDFYFPYLAAPATAARALSDQSLLLEDKATLAAEVETLRRANAILAARAGRVTELERENRGLRELERLKAPRHYRYEACEVLWRDPVNWLENFTVNVGSADGVMPGSVVLSWVPDGEGGKAALVGQVREVSQHTAKVFSVLNPELRLSVLLPGADAVGFLNAVSPVRGTAGLIALDFLPVNRNYTLGEEVVTTGMEALVPAGLGVGRLAEIESGNVTFSNKIYRYGGIRPLADLNALKLLIVVVPERGGGEAAQ